MVCKTKHLYTASHISMYSGYSVIRNSVIRKFCYKDDDQVGIANVSIFSVRLFSYKEFLLLGMNDNRQYDSL